LPSVPAAGLAAAASPRLPPAPARDQRSPADRRHGRHAVLVAVHAVVRPAVVLLRPGRDHELPVLLPGRGPGRDPHRPLAALAAEPLAAGAAGGPGGAGRRRGLVLAEPPALGD